MTIEWRSLLRNAAEHVSREQVLMDIPLVRDDVPSNECHPVFYLLQGRFADKFPDVVIEVIGGYNGAGIIRVRPKKEVVPRA
jgi:hypothetical protein